MQRVAIGRAWYDAQLFTFMDEPLSSLDARLRAELRVELKHIQADLGATVLYVTHDQVEALTMASRIGILEQGRLVQVGTPQDVLRTACEHLRSRTTRHPDDQLSSIDALPVEGAPPRTAMVGRARSTSSSCPRATVRPRWSWWSIWAAKTSCICWWVSRNS